MKVMPTVPRQADYRTHSHFLHSSSSQGRAEGHLGVMTLVWSGPLRVSEVQGQSTCVSGVSSLQTLLPCFHMRIFLPSKPVLMYGCEAWTISKQIQNKLEATEMWFLRRMLRIPWTAKKTNERVLNEANKRSLVRTIRKRQATFLRKTGTFGNNRKV
ncbi:RNA-directed DNA polymerase from mobile element jockey [Plakobranchus ocellatus]|uniref:RNA-directed DNA polymerase from mobile element jockey n=1 Tax=Plakobranchus ocellatus TaxID=259542 RepID=A0AAV4AWM8_9GAST|nr:RNA-directed DNA polymerase from mobile element jockey [Plakobranchus ocellatus]